VSAHRKWWPLPIALAVGLAAARWTRPEATGAQPESPQQTLDRLVAEIREEKAAAQERERAVREAEEAALTEEEREERAFRALWPPGTRWD
jgi:hypothetical protein